MIRGTAILAFRDIFTISDPAYDQDLRPVIVDVLTTMMRDAAVDNRRSSLNTFNSAIRNKVHLVMPYVSQLLPLVIDQTFKDTTLIREVQMGPFKHQVDDGLEVRKVSRRILRHQIYTNVLAQNAYETVYSLMETAPTRVDIARIYDRVVAGIVDDRSIQNLSNLMVTKLAVSAPDQTVRRLDDIGVQFSTIIGVKLKENAVRQEVEKADEARKAVMKVAVELAKLFPGETNNKAKWAACQEEMKKVQDGAMLKEVEKELLAARA